jgi:6-phosphogluconolactonase
MNTRIVGILALALLAGCGGGGNSGTPNGVPSKFLFAVANGGPNTSPGTVYSFAVYSDGSLSMVPGSPAPLGPYPNTLAVTHDSKFLYGSTGNFGLLAFQINADGSLTSAPSPSSPTSNVPAGIVAHPMADVLYESELGIGPPTCDGDLTVFAIDSATAALSPSSSVCLSTVASPTSSPVITPEGDYLYQSDVVSNTTTAVQIAEFSTDASGALNAVPGSPLSITIPSGSSIDQMVIDPSGKFLYAGYEFALANVGKDGGVAAYSIDAASGALTAVPGSPFSVGGVPNSVAIDASGKFLIVSISPRLGGPPGNCLAVLSIDPGTGALSPVPGSPFGPLQTCGGVAADPSGEYVYAGSAFTVSALSIDQATGELALIDQATVPTTGVSNLPLAIGVSFIALTH